MQNKVLHLHISVQFIPYLHALVAPMAPEPDRPKLRMRCKGVYHAPTHGPEEYLDRELSIPAKERDRRSLLQSRPSNTTSRRFLYRPKSFGQSEILQALYESAFPGWAASTLPRNLAARHLLQEALIPSPLSENAWAKLEPQTRAAWINVVDHTSGGTRALYNYIREKLPDVNSRSFSTKDFPSRCKEGLICNLVREGTSVDHEYYVTSRDTDEDDHTSILRTRWVNGDYMVPLLYAPLSGLRCRSFNFCLTSAAGTRRQASESCKKLLTDNLLKAPLHSWDSAVSVLSKKNSMGSS